MVSRNLPLILLALGAAVIVYMNVRHSSPCLGSCAHKHEKHEHAHTHEHGHVHEHAHNDDHAGDHEDPNHDPHNL